MTQISEEDLKIIMKNTKVQTYIAYGMENKTYYGRFEHTCPVDHRDIKNVILVDWIHEYYFFDKRVLELPGNITLDFPITNISLPHYVGDIILSEECHKFIEGLDGRIPSNYKKMNGVIKKKDGGLKYIWEKEFVGLNTEEVILSPRSSDFGYPKEFYLAKKKP